MLKTVLTEKLGTQVPVVSAPIGRGAGPRLLGAVAKAGAFGFTGLMHLPVEKVAGELAVMRAATAGRFGVNLTLIIDQMSRLEAALDAGVRAVSLWQGDPAPYIARVKQAGGVVFWTIGTPEEAARAADLGVDFVVCQGRDAGGHLIGAAPIMSLLPAVLDAAGGVPVLAAGGIADGRGLAAVLALGAVGGWMGTRFVASVESESHPAYKEAITRVRARELVETTLFDGGWGGSPHRVIRNSTVSLWEAEGCPSPGARPGEGEQIGRFPDGTPLLRYNIASPWEGMDGEWEPNALYAGASAQLIHEVKPVGAILAEMVAEAEDAIERAGRLRVMPAASRPAV